MPEELLTVEEVAQRLRLTPETVRRWLRSKRLTGTRIGGDRAGWRIPGREVDRIINEGMTTAGPQ